MDVSGSIQYMELLAHTLVILTMLGLLRSSHPLHIEGVTSTLSGNPDHAGPAKIMTSTTYRGSY